jgi:hypothetical protein
MQTLSVVAGSIAVLALGLGVSQPAQAVTQDRNIGQLGADMCKLSVPTTDTKVRPRASGFRNEGTTNAFVICTFHSDNTTGSLGNGFFTDAGVYLYTMDGSPHDVTCTGVASTQGGDAWGEPIQYVAHTWTVGHSDYGDVSWWTAADFGGTAGDPMPSYDWFSITCNLPPNVAINMGFANMEEDVGA